MTDKEFKSGVREDGTRLMQPRNFIADALRTKSPNFYGGRVSRREFVSAVNNFIHAANALDKVKKSLFYGRDNNLDPRDGEQSTDELPFRFGDTEAAVAIDLIHGVIGKATESGELLEALREAINEGKPLDYVNVNEEIGDGFWYDAILLNITGGTFDGVQDTIIAKLRARFPEAYADASANERDLDTERAILEGAAYVPEDSIDIGGEETVKLSTGDEATVLVPGDMSEAEFVDANIDAAKAEATARLEKPLIIENEGGSGKAAVERSAAQAATAFNNLANVGSGEPVEPTSDLGGELAKSPAARLHPLPDEKMAQANNGKRK